MVVVDTPRLLRLARLSNVQPAFGIVNGSHGYERLSAEPHTALLDSTLQVVNHLVQRRVLDEEPTPPARVGQWVRRFQGGGKREWSLG